MRSMSLLLLAATFTGCSTAPEYRSARAEANLQRELAGKVALKAIDCLPSFNSGNMVVIDDSTILFKQGRNKVYSNDVSGGSCAGLGSGHYALVTQQHGRLCRGDFAKVMDVSNGTTIGSCVIGEFIPYVSAAR